MSLEDTSASNKPVINPKTHYDENMTLKITLKNQNNTENLENKLKTWTISFKILCDYNCKDLNNTSRFGRLCILYTIRI